MCSTKEQESDVLIQEGCEDEPLADVDGPCYSLHTQTRSQVSQAGPGSSLQVGLNILLKLQALTTERKRIDLQSSILKSTLKPLLLVRKGSQETLDLGGHPSQVLIVRESITKDLRRS